MTKYLFTYEQFVAALEERPLSQSPLMWLGELDPRPPQASGWMMRWIKESSTQHEEKEETK